jgi:hypothetical protein
VINLPYGEKAGKPVEEGWMRELIETGKRRILRR